MITIEFHIVISKHTRVQVTVACDLPYYCDIVSRSLNDRFLDNGFGRKRILYIYIKKIQYAYITDKKKSHNTSLTDTINILLLIYKYVRD